MRNLKKILALVLALVMSLSLMATAGAADAAATSSETVTPAYETALQVLGKDGLKVFGGYTDGTIRPQNNITRAEVAAILYRIVTGDVTDAQAGIYTDMANVNFNDLTGANWAKGYINYCANAQLIVGVGGNQFKPLANITGYATLAMILRALGYDKNGEFKGSGWEIRTASKARELGILKNVSENQLGSSATRELVAELLFRAMLCDKVTYNALTQDYDKTGVTLGYSVFTLEEVKGVVVANEYADIRDKRNTPAADDTTVLRDSEGKDRTVNYASGLEDLGETRVAYTIENGKRDQYDLKNVKLENPGVDSIAYDGGEEKTAAQVTALIGRTDDNTKHLINFGESADLTETTIKVTYIASAIIERISARTSNDAREIFLDRYPFLADTAAVGPGVINLDVSYVGGGLYDVTYTPTVLGTGDFVARADWDAGHTFSVVNITVNGAATPFLKVEIAPKSEFTSYDQRIVEAIFSEADLVNNGVDIVNGEAYRGTQSNIDYSDWRSYEAFLEDCFDIDEDTTRVTTNGKGYWLKVIDNDNDGVTDWVFQTRYTVASVQSVNDSGVPTLETEGTWGAPDAMNVITGSVVAEETVEANDVVYYAVLDGVARVWKAEAVDVRVDSVNRNKLEVTVEGNSTPYEESANHEHSTRIEIGSGVTRLAGKTNYTFYLDKFGYLAAYAQNAKGNFTVLTDGWFHSLKNGAEYAVQAWDVDAKAIAQYDVTSGGNLFVDNDINDGSNSWGRIRKFNQVNCNTPAANPDTDDVHTIAAYIEADGETATLLPVDMVYDTQRVENSRDVELIDMDKTIPGNGINYSAAPSIWSSFNAALGTYAGNFTVGSADAAYEGIGADGKVEVRALSSTMYYYVYHTVPGNTASTVVKAFEGYAAGTAFLSDHEKTHVEDVYVVGTRATHIDATNGSATLNNVYYTANMVVIELDDDYYLNKHDQDEIFIYDFEVVSDRVNLETVQAIGPDGKPTEYVIDLTLSSGVIDQRVYDVAGNKRAPGLFYLRKTTTDGVWSVDRMSHAEIRASGNYDVGTVEYSAATLGNNYYQAKNWVCVSDNHTSVCTSATVTPASLAETSAKKNDTSSSLYYGLSYGTRNAATLTEYGVGNAADCLRENIGDNINGGANQVLVCHNGGSSIVYAISFAHGTSTNENVAQRVWRNVLLSPATAFDLTFYGVGDDDTAGAKVLAVDEDDLDKHTNYIEVSYATAKAWREAHPTATNALSVVGTGVSSKITCQGLNISAIPADPVVGGMTYVVEVTLADATKAVYYLTVDKADTTTGLEAQKSNGTWVPVDPDVDYEYENIKTSVENVKSYFRAVAPATIDESSWKFVDKDGKEVNSVNWESDYTATVTVVAEDGTTKQEYTIVFGEAPAPVFDLAAAKAAATANLDKVDTTGLTADEVKPLKDKALADIAAVTSTDKATAEAQLNKIVDDYATAVKAAQDAKDPDNISVKVQAQYWTNNLRNEDIDWAEAQTFLGKKGDTTVKVPVTAIEKWTAQYALTVDGTPVALDDAEENYLVPVPDDLTTTVIVEVRMTVGGFGPAAAASRASRVLADEVPMVGTVMTKKGMKPDPACDQSLVNGPESFVVDWTSAREPQTIGKFTFWTVDAVMSAEHFADLKGDYSTLYAIPNKEIVNTEDPGDEITDEDRTKTQAKVDAYTPDRFNELDEAVVTDAKKTAADAIADATTAEELEAAYNAYVEAINKAIDALPETDPLAEARANAKAEIEAYKATQITDLLSKNDQTAVENEKNKYLALIEIATSEEQIKKHVDAYTAFVDAKVPHTDDSIVPDEGEFVPDVVTSEDKADLPANAHVEKFTNGDVVIKKVTQDDENGKPAVTLTTTVPADLVPETAKTTDLASATAAPEVVSALEEAGVIGRTRDAVETTKFNVKGPAGVPPVIDNKNPDDTYIIATCGDDVATQIQAANTNVTWTVTVYVKVTVTTGADAAVTVPTISADINFDITFPNLDSAKADAKKAVDARLGTIKPAEVQEAYDNLVNAINAAETTEALEAIYKGSALVSTNDLVKALDKAIRDIQSAAETAKALANAKKAAVAAVEARISAKNLAPADVSTEYQALVDEINSAADLEELALVWTDSALVEDHPMVKALDAAMRKARSGQIVSVYAAPVVDHSSPAATDLIDTDTYAATWNRMTDSTAAISVVANEIQLHKNENGTMGYWAGFFIEAPKQLEDPDTGVLTEVKAMKAVWGGADALKDETATVTALDTDTVNGNGDTKGAAFYRNAGGTKSYLDARNTATVVWYSATDGKALSEPVTFQITWDTSVSNKAPDQVTKVNLHDTRAHANFEDKQLAKDYDVTAVQSAWNTVDVEVYAKDIRQHQNGNDPANLGYWIGFGVKAPAGATQFKYQWSGMDAMSTMVTELDGLNTLDINAGETNGNNNSAADAPKGVAFYYDAAKTTSDTVILQWYDSSSNLISQITYNVKFNTAYIDEDAARLAGGQAVARTILDEIVAHYEISKTSEAYTSALDYINTRTKAHDEINQDGIEDCFLTTPGAGVVTWWYDEDAGLTLNLTQDCAKFAKLRDVVMAKEEAKNASAGASLDEVTE